MIIYKNKQTGEVEAVFENCDSPSQRDNPDLLREEKADGSMELAALMAKRPKVLSLKEILIRKGLLTEADFK